MLKNSKSIQRLKILFKKYCKSSQLSILEKPAVRYMISRINRYFNQLVLLNNLFPMNLLGVTFGSVQFISVTQSCLTLCDPMDCSTPVFPVHHQLLEPTQTQVHQVGDVIQPSHPLSSPFLPPSIFSSIRVLSNESVLSIRWPKYWSFSFSICLSNEYSGLIFLRTG